MKRKIVLTAILVMVFALCLCACEITPSKPTDCEHQLQVHSATAATCTESGNTEYWQCTKCDKLFADKNGKTEITLESTVVAALGHTEETIPAVEPTCTETGLTEGTKCSVCETILVEQQQVAAKGHDWGEWTETTAATCTTEGSEERTCSVCNEKETRPTEKLPHTEETIPAVEPTCTETGLTEGTKCSVCETILVEQQQVAAKGHDWGEWTETTAATCTTEGSEERSCSVCNEKETRLTEKLPHTEVAVPAVEPTCTETGLTEGTKCSVCNTVLVEQQQVAANGHDWQWVVDKAPNQTEEGLKHEECSRCYAIRNENTAIEKLSHTHTLAEIAATEPTCTESGNTQYWQCTKCDKLFADSNGKTEITLESTVVSAKGHTEETIPAVEPTCTETGLTEGAKCSVCNTVLVEQQEIPLKNHKFADGTEITPEELAKAQILDTNNNSRGIMILGDSTLTCNLVVNGGVICPVCEKIIVLYICAPHTEVAIPAVEPTCTETGLTEGTKCSVCNTVLVEQQEIPLKNHKFADGTEITPEERAKVQILDTNNNSRGIMLFEDSTLTCNLVVNGGVTCPVCDQIIVLYICAPHTEVAIPAVEPTCTETGLTEGTKCSVCETILVEQQQVAAKGHNFVGGVCTVCGEKEPLVASDGLEYTLNSDGTAYSVAGIGTCADTDVVIPSTYNKLPVTAIGEDAFYGCSCLTIYCEAASKPIGWSNSWNPDSRPVVWAYNAQ